MLISCVYIIKNNVNGKMYVGSTSNFKTRVWLHKNDLFKNKHKNLHLQAAWNKYGKDYFTFEILERTTDLENREQYWIDNLKASNNEYGYNIRKIAVSNLGFKHSEASKKKMSIARNGIKLSDTTKMRMSKSKIGHKVSDETKTKIGAANRRKITNPKIIEAMRLRSNDHKRKSEKWPHELGCRCLCEECKDKKNIEAAKRLKARKYKQLSNLLKAEHFIGTF